MRTRSPFGRAVAIAAVAACTGCQTFRPMQAAAVTQGELLRVTTARPVPVRLREVTIEQARLVDGEAIQVRGDTLLLSAMWVERDAGLGTPGEGWTVGIPLDAVATLTQKRVSWLRSAILGAVILVGSAAGWRTFGGGAGGERSGHPPGETL